MLHGWATLGFNLTKTISDSFISLVLIARIYHEICIPHQNSPSNTKQYGYFNHFKMHIL